MKRRNPWVLGWHQYVLPAGLTLLVIFLSAFVVPITSGTQDAPGYLESARGFLENGLRWPMYREPFYPLFLAALTFLGLNVERCISVIQTGLFVSSFYFFVNSFLSKRYSSRSLWMGALCMALIPTFLIPLNGAIYTESISTSLVFVLLGALVHGFYSRGSFRIAYFLGATAVAVALALTKGSFIYMHFALPFIFALALWASGMMPVLGTKRIIGFLVILIVIAIAGRAGVSLWFGLRPGEPVFSKRIYQRGGSVLYGRVSYAQKFDFVHETVPFLMQAFSEKGCRALLGDVCGQYGYGAEEGYGKALSGNRSDEELMAEGIQIVLHSPVRQSLYCVYIWMRFIFHHSTTGFARLTLPGLGDFVHSGVFVALLKLFNLVLYFLIPTLFVLRWKNKTNLVRIWKDLPSETRFGTILYISYGVSLIVVHGFVWAVVRMVYPIAPFLVLLNWQAYGVEIRRSKG